MGGYPSGARGRATVDPRRPQAWGICDRDGFRHNRRDLRWQYQWQGATIQNQRILVCQRCYDELQEQLRAYAVPPDPIPIRDPRPDLSIMGNGPTVITTTACVPTVWERDGFGNLILDGFGNPIAVIPGTQGTLVLPDLTRTILQFTAPSAFGIFVSPAGGVCDPLWPGTEFMSPTTSFQAFGVAAQQAVTYFTTVPGLTIVVETQDGGIAA